MGNDLGRQGTTFILQDLSFYLRLVAEFALDQCPLDELFSGEIVDTDPTTAILKAYVCQIQSSLSKVIDVIYDYEDEMLEMIRIVVDIGEESYEVRLNVDPVFLEPVIDSYVRAQGHTIKDFSPIIRSA